MSLIKRNSPPPSAEANQHDPFAALRFRDYRLFTLGRVLLSVGSQMQTVAIGWELYERTNSAMVLGGVGLAQVLPMIALTLVAGDIADRRSRKLTILLSVMLLALCSLGLAVLSYTRGAVFLIYGCLALIGVGRAFLKPASDAIMWQLIPVNVFTNAATWNSSSFQLASVAGPALGGLGIAVLGSATGVYILAAIAGFLCFLFMAAIKEKTVERVTEPISLQVLAAGAKFIWENQLILAAITLDMFAVLLGGAVALLPVFAKDILQVGPVELGYLQAAPSIGALIMAVTLAYLPPLRKAGTALLWSVIGFGVVTIIFGLSRWFWLSLIMLTLSGALDTISVVIRHTLVQIRTPDQLRGRVAAINSVFISASNELGGFESGLTAALFGPVLSVVGGGIGTILVVVATAAIWPGIVKLGSLQEYE
ncbi:MFS transporter [Anabaena sp. FACHB-709]|uniref:Putative integral membrane efflux protein n=1 Tax=Trichormus variabilis NIES-23 TaxID=1973479 RepID=A0A1Z4KQX4_ANAVA|nr:MULTISPECIES: MFS transporter [Nostocaceae]BAY71337.1 putative integral membrane efflux protein [Trichormus variabilis NIES-23]HBW28666.1 MFS transporter [Nostoc sp. UBA8866]MBD2263786.1 MFS transporter [Anabaena sp. FACHB-709]MBD2274986.1 MFS transporter [Nostoc sp. PCC 7120 = FACHB-418]MBD2284882.1 MFS transporter [Anabaena cylindrica FACHB-170]